MDSSPTNRRRFFAETSGVIMVASVFAYPHHGFAFDNGLPGRYANREPAVGTMPHYLGVAERTSISGTTYQGLAPCDGRPNCYCSSTPFRDSPARYIEPWGGPENSIADIQNVIDTYQVGQQGIDGGGYSIVTYNKEQQYLYVQFQSYKYGYIDDVEFWYNPSKQAFDVRSASRLGQSDLGVNAKRLEYIGGRLEKELGWKLKRRKNGFLV
ncbi:DUF1499 domain containing protein [Nitzschia inconspicua]|uniref:DUF1499 domain containing protein n=1 Tax=Nitzschia inconspicua TaxID=303405 RepID=A0A9K3Q498_9STRA|nr:DUF1499 domain containing protein [Nitzschia inconspicua]